jgi:hypothetical protein
MVLTDLLPLLVRVILLKMMEHRLVLMDFKDLLPLWTVT